MTPEQAEWKQACDIYLTQRVGTYETRCRRYDQVANVMLFHLYAWSGMVVYDLGAGMCEFDKRLRELDLHYRYVPVDGCIDGTDLNHWYPPESDIVTMIEVIEHLDRPYTYLNELQKRVRQGIVLTTPNPEVVDVRAMDDTHKHGIWPSILIEMGFEVERHSLYTNREDTIVAWYRANR